jgi:hypothetical protein
MGTDNSVNTMQDELFEHRGETTTAQVLEKVNISNRYYIKIKINKGNFQDKMGLMVYNKNFETIEDKTIIVRPWTPSKQQRDYEVDEVYPVSFITDEVPKDFTPKAPNDILFYAEWRRGMSQSKRIPSMIEIKRFYNPGIAIKILFLKYVSPQFHQSYNIYFKQRPETCIVTDPITFKEQNIDVVPASIRKYWGRRDRLPNNPFPSVIVADYGVLPNTNTLETIDKLLTDDSDKRYEPVKDVYILEMTSRR